ncbi:MAG: hypothetical protein ACE14W_00880 [Candidatus Velamenicoccus archaeovorus]
MRTSIVRAITIAAAVSALSLVAPTDAASVPAEPSTASAVVGSRGRSFVPAPTVVLGEGTAPLARGPYPAWSDRHRLARVARPGSASARPAVPPATDRPLAPVAGLHFDAIRRIGPNWPADPSGAIGHGWIFTAVNTSYALYDRAGAAVIPPTSFEPFFTYPSATQVFDPKVVYDPYGQMFVLVYLAVNDRLERSWIQLVTVPDATADDQATWCARRIRADQVPGHGRRWADYPGLGFNADRVVVTTNQFDFDDLAFDYAQILSFPKASLSDCTQPTTFDRFARAATTNPGGSPAFTIQPAQSAGTPTETQYLLSFQRTRRSSSLVVWRLAMGSTGPRLTRAALPVERVSIAPFGTQGGGSLRKADTWWDPGDLRLINAFYDADLDRLYAAHVIFRDLRPDPGPGGYPEAAIRWYEVAPGVRLRTSSVIRRGIVGEPQTDAGWPVVATDGAGNLFVAYSRASAVRREFLSAWVAEIPPGTNRATSTELAPGTARFEAARGPERWGDFNGIARDPLDPSRLVVVDQYAKADGRGPTRDWQETVDVVSHA